MEGNPNGPSPDELAWSVHPLRQTPKKAVLLVLVMALVVVSVQYAFESWMYAAIAAVFLAGTMRDFFLPTRYELRPDGVRVVKPTGTTERKWTDFKSYRVGTNGVLLSPFKERTALENYRGVYLFYAGNSAAVLDVVKRYLKE